MIRVLGVEVVVEGEKGKNIENLGVDDYFY
jgi:hypothetical protein